jgi:hypothetical protein
VRVTVCLAALSRFLFNPVCLSVFALRSAVPMSDIRLGGPAMKFVVGSAKRVRGVDCGSQVLSGTGYASAYATCGQLPN